MKRVFVCSPLRGRDGQPAEENIALARLLMRAVFDAGHAPFVPHLLYPQVLTEAVGDLRIAFDANFAFLSVCDEIWVYAQELAGCSGGMRREVEFVEALNARAGLWPPAPIAVRFMPPEFEAVASKLKAGFQRHVMTSHVGTCARCQEITGVNSQGLCLKCFADGTPVRHG